MLQTTQSIDMFKPENNAEFKCSFQTVNLISSLDRNDEIHFLIIRIKA